VIVFMDADLATDLDALPELVAATADAEVVVGSRRAPGAEFGGLTPVRRATNAVFGVLVRAATGLDLSDTQCGFKAFRRSSAHRLFRLSRVDGFAFDVEVLLLASTLGYRIGEVPVRWRAVEGGKVRLVRDSCAMLLDVVRLKRRAPTVARARRRTAVDVPVERAHAT